MKVIELFAGVGGFRIGLDRVDKDYFETIWSNQFEPTTKRQHASEVYVARFGPNGHVNADIATVRTETIPDHDMLCGGFPCQDYSVARNLGQAAGLVGKKGVLWWEIERIVREKGEKAPQILFLENVDRLLISPAKQRGRDFAVILQSLADNGYIVEWRSMECLSVVGGPISWVIGKVLKLQRQLVTRNRGFLPTVFLPRLFLWQMTIRTACLKSSFSPFD